MTFFEFIKSVCGTVFIENRNICIALFAFIAIFICVIFLIHLLMRPYRLWYWKVNKTSREIAGQLNELNTKVADIERSTVTGAGKGEKIAAAAEGTSGASQAADADKPEGLFESGDTAGTVFENRKTDIMARGYNTDKQGRTYTEEEITKLIKD